jgi:hypothetical protein
MTKASAGLWLISAKFYQKWTLRLNRIGPGRSAEYDRSIRALTRGVVQKIEERLACCTPIFQILDGNRRAIHFGYGLDLPLKLVRGSQVSPLPRRSRHSYLIVRFIVVGSIKSAQLE